MPPSNNYIDKMSTLVVKNLEEASAVSMSLGSLKDLITSEFHNIQADLKDFRQDIKNIDSRLIVIDSKLDASEKTHARMKLEVGGLKEASASAVLK